MSTLFIDIDGTIVPHLENDDLDKLIHMEDDIPVYIKKPEKLLNNVKQFFDSLDPNIHVIFTTARFERHRNLTEYMLKQNNIK